MNHPRPVILSACLCALFTTACHESTSRGAYPDNSADTQKQADNIRMDAQSRKEAADREFADKATALAFREGQSKEKTRQELATVDLDRDRSVAPLIAKQEALKAQGQRDKERVDNETAELLKAPGSQEATIQAEANSKKADIEQKTIAAVTTLVNDSDKAENVAKAKRLDIATAESQRFSAIQQERTIDEQALRKRKIAIDTDANLQLTKLGEKSGEQGTKERAAAAKTDDNDRKITSAIRVRFADDKTLAARTQDVQVSTNAGVVVVSGTVAGETERRAVLDQAGKVSGVVRVEDKLAIR